MPKKKNEARAKANQLNLVSAFQLSVYSSLCGGGKKIHSWTLIKQGQRAKAKS